MLLPDTEGTDKSWSRSDQTTSFEACKLERKIHRNIVKLQHMFTVRALFPDSNICAVSGCCAEGHLSPCMQCVLNKHCTQLSHHRPDGMLQLDACTATCRLPLISATVAAQSSSPRVSEHYLCRCIQTPQTRALRASGQAACSMGLRWATAFPAAPMHRTTWWKALEAC